MLDRYISQSPREDSGFLYTQFMQISTPAFAEICRSRIQRVITQFDKALIDFNRHGPICTPCLFSFAGCPFTSSDDSSWTDHVRQCHLQRCSCTRTEDSAQSLTTIAVADDDHLPPMLRKCPVFGCFEQFSGENVLEQWLYHLYTHVEQDYAQAFKALEGNSEFLGWSSRPDAGIIQKVAGKWTLCKCLCETLEDSGIVLPLPPESPLPMDFTDYAFSRPSPVKDDVFSRKSIPAAETDSIPSHSNNEDSQESDEVEQVSPSELLNEFVHFTLSWFSAWLASQPGNTELNPGSQSTPGSNGRNQGESSQRRKRKARGQNDENRGEWKARRTGRSTEDEPDDDGSGDPCAAGSSQPDSEVENLLACPFYKRNPFNYRHRKFDICVTGVWTTYHRVREHLYRKHLQPAHLCGRCFADFKDDTSLQRHSMSFCSANRDNPYLRPTQREQLKAANMRGKGEAEKWKDMYRLLFPGEDVPDPYKNTSSFNEHVMRLRSAIVGFILNSPNAMQNPLPTFNGIMSAAIQAIYSTRGHDARGSDSPGVSHGATEYTPSHYPHYLGHQIAESLGLASASFESYGAGLYVAAANDFIGTWGPFEGVVDTTGYVNDQTGVVLFDVLGEFSETLEFADHQNESAVLNESQAVSYTAAFTEAQNGSGAFDEVGVNPDVIAFEDDQMQSLAPDESQAVAPFTEDQNYPGTFDELGVYPNMTAFEHDQIQSLAPNESQAFLYTASFTEGPHHFEISDGLGGNTDMTAFEHHQDQSVALNGSQAFLHTTSFTDGPNLFAISDGLGGNMDTTAFEDDQPFRWIGWLDMLGNVDSQKEA